MPIWYNVDIRRTKMANREKPVYFKTSADLHDRLKAFIRKTNEASDYHKYTIGEVIVQAVKEYLDTREYLEGEKK
jgi:hypothetical protein